MKQASSFSPRQERGAQLPPTMTLAIWRFRRTWRLLLVIGLGMLMAVLLVCSVPLFSQAAMTAGLRQVLTTSPEAAELTIQASPDVVSDATVAQDDQQVHTFMHTQLGDYLDPATHRMLQLTGALAAAPVGQTGDTLELLGTSLEQAAPHLTVLSGRLPQDQGTRLEIAITAVAATALKAGVGSTLTVSLGSYLSSGPTYVDLQLWVVGVIAPLAHDPFWHGEDFQPRVYNAIGQQLSIEYKALLSQTSLLATLTAVAQHIKRDALPLAQGSLFLTWYYRLAPSQVTIDALDALIARLDTAQVQIIDTLGATGAFADAHLSGQALPLFGAPSSLERYRDRVLVARIPVALLVLVMLGLVLFFVNSMATMLVERQAEAIALLRSRGARRRQIIGAFAIQGLGLGALAGIAGVLLAVVMVALLGRQLLTPADQPVLLQMTAAPVHTALGVGWFALAGAASAMVALLLGVQRAASKNILAFRHELARPTSRPLWQRLQLDLVAACMALVGYGLSAYVQLSGAVNAQVNEVIAGPLALVAPCFLLVAGLSLFPRGFPLLLRAFASRLARLRAAAPGLALAQMTRAPGAALRTILLLTLAMTFASFTLVLTASEGQHILAAAAQQTGADFSGTLPPSSAQTLANTTTPYRRIPGVLSVTLGYVVEASASGNVTTNPLQVQAVDTGTFAQTAVWTEQQSSQSIDALMRQLPTQQAGSARLPAIVDALTWEALHLSSGAPFTLGILTPQAFNVSFVAVAEVQHIPGVNDSLEGGTADYTPPGGILINYQTLAALYKHTTNTNLPPNYVWLRTSDDQTLLNTVRAALSRGALRLDPLADRRALITAMQHDPLYVDVVAALSLGTAAAVLLAFVGSLLATWLSIRIRLTSFALLRALGSTPRQLASVLFWELGLIYATALTLGALFGAFLVATIVPSVVFTSVPTTNQTITSGEFYVLQRVLPVQITVAPALALALAALLALWVLSLLWMVRVVSKPTLSQTLRLNED